MLPPHNSKIAFYLILENPMLGVVKAGGVYRFFCFDELRMDPASLDIHDEHWGMTFEEFSDNAKIYNHKENPEILEFYPESQNQMMLEYAWNNGQTITALMLADLVKVFKPVQYGRIKKVP